MRNLIVAGTSRAGKSKLAKRIAREFNMTYIPFDSIVSTLEKICPESGIAHMDENLEMSKRQVVFLKEFISHLEYEDIHYVLDLYQIYPSDILTAYNKDSHIVVYLGYPSLTGEEKLVDVRKYARDKDWTKNACDEELIGILNLFIDEGKRMAKQCKDEGLSFFDTGENFDDVLESAYEYARGMMSF